MTELTDDEAARVGHPVDPGDRLQVRPEHGDRRVGQARGLIGGRSLGRHLDDRDLARFEVGDLRREDDGLGIRRLDGRSRRPGRLGSKRGGRRHGDELIGRDAGAAGDLSLIGELVMRLASSDARAESVPMSAPSCRRGRRPASWACRRARSPRPRRRVRRLSSFGGKPMRYATARPASTATSAATTTSRRWRHSTRSMATSSISYPLVQRSDPSGRSTPARRASFHAAQESHAIERSSNNADGALEHHRRAPGAGSRRTAWPLRCLEADFPVTFRPWAPTPRLPTP